MVQRDDYFPGGTTFTAISHTQNNPQGILEGFSFLRIDVPCAGNWFPFHFSLSNTYTLKECILLNHFYSISVSCNFSQS